jgi:hypothetical protein
MLKLFESVAIHLPGLFKCQLLLAAEEHLVVIERNFNFNRCFSEENKYDLTSVGEAVYFNRGCTCAFICVRMCWKGTVFN